MTGLKVIDSTPTAISKYLRERVQTIKIARQCLDYKLIKCDNKNCINVSCPLNKEYDKKEKT